MSAAAPEYVRPGGSRREKRNGHRVQVMALRIAADLIPGTAIEEELRKTDLLEEAPVAEDTVCPGTRVTYREVASGADLDAVGLIPGLDADGLGKRPELRHAVAFRVPHDQLLLSGGLGIEPGV